MAESEKPLEGIHILDLDIRGSAVPVHVNTAGRFLARLDGNDVGANDLESLRVLLVERSRRKAVKVSVPFCALSEARPYVVRRGTATGLHAGTGKVLVTWHAGHAPRGNEQVDSWKLKPVLRSLEDKEEVEVVRLRQAKEDAAEALASYVAARRLDVTEAVKEAVAQAVKEVAEKESHDNDQE